MELNLDVLTMDKTVEQTQKEEDILPKISCEVEVIEPLSAVELVHNPELGRHLRAKRNIKAGEIVLSDLPILMAPNGGTNGTCLSCCLPYSLSHCSKCGWPVCNSECEENEHHSKYECPIFAKYSITPKLKSPLDFVDSAEFIKVLRLLLMCREPKKREEILKLEPHLDERKNIPRVIFMSTLVRSFIHDLCHLKDEFDEERINFVLGVVDVNAFRHVVHPDSRSKRGDVEEKVERNATFLYPLGSMAAHGCRRNVRWETLPNGELQMWAAEDVEKGELLSHPYVDLMQGSPDRRRQLKEQFYFDCQCERCSDPTELGTFVSALKCPTCDKGYLLAEDPLDYETKWHCCKCECVKPSSYEREIIAEMKLQEKAALAALQLGGTTQATTMLAKIISKYRGKVVHPNHSLVLSVEYHLVHIMAKRMKKQQQEMMQEMKKMCNKYLRIASVFYPGIQ